MTPRTDPFQAALAKQQPRVTVDDLRHKALAVRDTVKDEARRVLDQPTSRYVIAGAVIFAVAVSVAYLAGTMASRRRRPPQGRPPSAPPTILL